MDIYIYLKSEIRVIEMCTNVISKIRWINNISVRNSLSKTLILTTI